MPALHATTSAPTSRTSTRVRRLRNLHIINYAKITAAKLLIQQKESRGKFKRIFGCAFTALGAVFFIIIVRVIKRSVTANPCCS